MRYNSGTGSDNYPPLTSQPNKEAMMPAEIISTDTTEFEPALLALADEFDALEDQEHQIVLEDTKLQAYRTEIHVKRARILMIARKKLPSDEQFGKWRNSRASLQSLGKNTIHQLQKYGAILGESSMEDSPDYSKLPSMRMVRPLTHKNVPLKVAQEAVAKHISGEAPLDYAEVKSIRNKYVPALPPPKVSMADYATIELRLAVQPHLTGEILLGIGHGACEDAIKIVAKAFRQKYHPDKGGSPLDYHRINDAAAEVLKNVR